MRRRIPEQQTSRARALRNSATEPERLLWHRLSQFRPRFTRQLVIGPYIVDLACRSAKVAVELDGGQHIEAAAYDRRRTNFLELQGWSVVRLWNSEVLADPGAAAEWVLGHCAARLGGTHPRPLPSREGRIRQPRSRKLAP
jgi:very-short-patch-repair endonuclease